MNELKRVYTKDLKKGETYWLTFDYTGYVGTPVRYIRTLKAPYFSKGDAEVKGVNGVIFVVHKNAWLFAEDPLSQGCGL